MKKLRLFSVLTMLAMLLLALAGCGTCEHEWQAANCKNPKTCKLCGEIEGEATEDHRWVEATTDDPKTCSVCGLTEGDKLDVDERFTTNACKEVFGSWVGQYEQDGEQIGLGSITLPTKLTISFFSNGEVQIISEPEDPIAFKEELANYLRDMLYRTYEDQGLTKADAEAMCMDSYGKDAITFFRERADQIVDGLKSTSNMVYYVEEGVIYMAEDWDSDMKPYSYELQDGKMLLDDSDLGQVLEMRRTAVKK